MDGRTGTAKRAGYSTRLFTTGPPGGPGDSARRRGRARHGTLPEVPNCVDRESTGINPGDARPRPTCSIEARRTRAARVHARPAHCTSRATVKARLSSSGSRRDRRAGNRRRMHTPNTEAAVGDDWHRASGDHLRHRERQNDYSELYSQSSNTWTVDPNVATGFTPTQCGGHGWCCHEAGNDDLRRPTVLGVTNRVAAAPEGGRRQACGAGSLISSLFLTRVQRLGPAQGSVKPTVDFTPIRYFPLRSLPRHLDSAPPSGGDRH